ncbi:MAG: ABC transporter permease [Thermodesulfobacteriota bacterium]
MVNWIGLYTFIRREIDRMFRVATQTLITPWISALLYIFIFGHVVGRKIDTIAGVEYIDFVLPGILMMNVISSAFTHCSSSLHFQRFIRHIEEILVAPFSHIEMVIGFVVGGVIRAVVVGIGVLIIAVFFGAAGIDHLLLFLFYTVAIAIIFALLGMVVGLWAQSFEQLSILNTFVILPFTFLGGVFYSITMLPEKMQTFALLNPFFYFIDGIRYSMIGVRESNHTIGAVVIITMIISLWLLVVTLFKRGWRLRL